MGIRVWLVVGLLCRREGAICDWGAYLARYADLSAAFGTDYVAAEDHYNTLGVDEGRDCTLHTLSPTSSPTFESLTPITVASGSMSTIYLGWSAAKCFDGNIGPDADLCHSESEANPWLQLDLGASFTVTMVRIYNRQGELAPKLLASHTPTDLFLTLWILTTRLLSRPLGVT
jgi:hypothetical protein